MGFKCWLPLVHLFVNCTVIILHGHGIVRPDCG
uniref:Uncharacterized protein n=1 Tax=Arundo donax TaxID=35708 RepID=A0A0A8ZWL1_ARUDO